MSATNELSGNIFTPADPYEYVSWVMKQRGGLYLLTERIRAGDSARAELAQLRADVARLTQERDAAQAAIAAARFQLRSTALNWQEDCLFEADDILTAALAAHPAQKEQSQ